MTVSKKSSATSALKPTKPQPNARITRGRVPQRGIPGHLSEEERAAAQALFLDHFKQTGNISAACRVAAIDRSTFYRWKEEDGAFCVAYQYAEEQAADLLDLAARNRAINGVERVIVSMGKVVMIADPKDPTGKRQIPLKEREYSDAVLLRMLQAHHPKYRNTSHVDVTSGGERLQPVEISHDPQTAAAARAFLAALTAEKRRVQEGEADRTNTRPFRDSSGQSW